MKLRVRINRQTSRMELPGEEPTLQELSDLIKQTLLSCLGLGADTEFSLSLNGSELLSESGRTLSACGIVSGDLISVLLPQSPPAAMSSTERAAVPTIANSQQTTSATTSQPQSSSSSRTLAAPTEPLQTSETSPPVWKPMLCSEAEDGEAPLSLERLYHMARTTTPNDAIMVAAHLLMLETGFTPQGSELKSGKMPARSVRGVYRLHYAHPLCGSSLVSMVAVGMGPLLLINVVVKVTKSIDTSRKLQLNPSSYMTDGWPRKNAATAFKDLKKLSRTFRDQLAYPLIAAAREAMALPVAFALPALPPELLLRVLRLLDVRSLVRLSTVSWHFNGAALDWTLWKHLYLRDFSDADRTRSRDTDWKQLYKKSYKIRSELRHPVRPYSLPPFPLRDIITPVPRPLFPPLPGIIGGEYDQRPNLLPRPRYDPIGPLLDPNSVRPRLDFRRPGRGRPADIRRGFI